MWKIFNNLYGISTEQSEQTLSVNDEYKNMRPVQPWHRFRNCGPPRTVQMSGFGNVQRPVSLCLSRLGGGSQTWDPAVAFVPGARLASPLPGHVSHVTGDAITFFCVLMPLAG